MRVITLFCALAATAIPAAAQEKDKQVAIGELVFFSCQSCHFVGDAELVKLGPHLNDLFGRKPGSLPGYAYSEAMVAFGQDKVWDEATLTAFINDPGGVVEGTKMAFHGHKNGQEVQALLAYLATFDPDGMK